jgi:hypothetical protein
LRAFFPGYPQVARGPAGVFRCRNSSTTEIVVALSLISAVPSVVAAILLWRMVEDELGTTVARETTVLFLAGPYALFLDGSYSEALYLVFAIGAWMCARRGRQV